MADIRRSAFQETAKVGFCKSSVWIALFSNVFSGDVLFQVSSPACPLAEERYDPVVRGPILLAWTRQIVALCNAHAENR